MLTKRLQLLVPTTVETDRRLRFGVYWTNIQFILVLVIRWSCHCRLCRLP